MPSPPTNASYLIRRKRTNGVATGWPYALFVAVILAGGAQIVPTTSATMTLPVIPTIVIFVINQMRGNEMKFLMLSAVLLLASCGKEEAKVTGPVVERAKDVVCGMWIPKDEKARLIGTALWDNGEYWFCAADCRTEFLKNPAKYGSTCDCRKIKPDCKCEHCQGKMVPCDCKWN